MWDGWHHWVSLAHGFREASRYSLSGVVRYIMVVEWLVSVPGLALLGVVGGKMVQ